MRLKTLEALKNPGFDTTPKALSRKSYSLKPRTLNVRSSASHEPYTRNPESLKPHGPYP